MGLETQSQGSTSPKTAGSNWAWDYLVILGLIGIVFVVFGLPMLLGWLDLAAIWSDRTLSDVAITVLTVIPTLVYFTATEAGPRHATWGKRKSGLRVAADGEPLVGAALVRNIVKLLPWQFGHLAATRFATAPEATTSATVFFVVSMVLLAAVALPPLFGKRGLHEVASGTTVVPADQPASTPV